LEAEDGLLIVGGLFPCQSNPDAQVERQNLPTGN
jgi:hypothetical protein